MAEICDFEKARLQRAIGGIIKNRKEFKSPGTGLNTCGVQTYFSGYVIGGEGPEKDLLCIIAYDISRPFAFPIGSIRIERGRWANLRTAADLLLQQHAEHSG